MVLRFSLKASYGFYSLRGLTREKYPWGALGENPRTISLREEGAVDDAVDHLNGAVPPGRVEVRTPGVSTTVL